MSVWERLLRRVAAVPELPAGFTGVLEPDERIVTTGELAGGGHRQGPEVVRERVTSSIRSGQHRELPGGGAWFVQRRIPGRDGVVLQVRADPGTAPGALEMMASEVASRLPRPAPPG